MHKFWSIIKTNKSWIDNCEHNYLSPNMVLNNKKTSNKNFEVHSIKNKADISIHMHIFNFVKIVNLAITV